MTTEITRCPEDVISELCFPPLASDSNLLLVSSWDSKVRLYDVEKNVIRSVQSHMAPVLSCQFAKSADKCVSGGLARDLRLYDFNKESDSLIGKHAEAVKTVRYSPKYNLIFSGSWDQTVAAWDTRSHSICHRLNIGAKVFGIALTPAEGRFDKLLVADSNKRVSIYDMRRLDKPEQIRDQSVKYQIRCIEPFADGMGFALGTAEGRVSYEYFDPEVNVSNDRSYGADGVPTPPTETQFDSLGTTYSFKCHRLKMQYDDIAAYAAKGVVVTAEMDKIFPVNAIAFNARYNTFATGGGDGNVAFWDGAKKKRLWRLSKPLPTSVTSLGFSADSSRLAIAVSYDYTRGANADARVMHYAQIIVREVSPDDIRRK